MEKHLVKEGFFASFDGTELFYPRFRDAPAKSPSSKSFNLKMRKKATLVRSITYCVA